MSSRREPPPARQSGAPTSPQRGLDNTPLPLAVAAYINEAAKRRPGERLAARARPREAEGSPACPGRGRATRHRGCQDAPRMHGADHGAFVVDSTPLHMAALGGAVDVVDLLEKRRGRQRARAEGYTTPLKPPRRTQTPTSSSTSTPGTTTPRWPAERSDPNRGGQRGGTGDGADSDAIGDGSASANASLTRPTPHPDSDDSETADDDFAAMAALRDAAGPLRALMHLVNEWHAEVTPHALAGVSRGR